MTGVACHLTSALQLFIHTLDPLADALLLQRNTVQSAYTKDDAWIYELIQLIHSYSSNQQESETFALDPTKLYKALEASSSSLISSLDPQDLGDAATALRLLLQAIRQYYHQESKNNNYNTTTATVFYQLLEESIFGGRQRQELVGTLVSDSSDNLNSDDVILLQPQKTKFKERPMPCPLMLSAELCGSLEEALAQAAVVPQLVAGYKWPTSDDKDDVSLTTHKTCPITKLPQHLFLHVQRFTVALGEIKQMRHGLDIPAKLDLTPYCYRQEEETEDANKTCHVHDSCRQYKLQGAILYVSDSLNMGKTEQEEEKYGHYVALIRQQGSSEDDDKEEQWTLLDDETVHHISAGEADDMMRGGFDEARSPFRNSCATVLSYQRCCLCCRDVEATKALMEELHESIQASAPPPPEELVGRRLHVRWNKKKFYAGIVSAYDATTGKHTIRYDDGDVREYVLHKKTIRWENGD